MSEEPVRALRYLSGSAVRPAILERLVDEPARPAELVAFADVSRTTVHRTLAELGDRNWVRRIDDGYDATPAGELALEIFERARDRFRTLERLEPFWAHAGAAAADLEPEWLCDARLAAATDANPHYPLEWYADRLAAVDATGETADGRAWLRATAPFCSRQLLAAHERIADAGTPTEFVVDDATLRTVAAQSPERLREALTIDAFELYVAPTQPSLGIALVGDRTLLSAYDDGRLVVTLEETDDRLRAWAADRYDRVRGDARRVPNEADLPPS